MNTFKIGDRVGHAQVDLDAGYFEKDPKGLGTVTEVLDGYPYPIIVEWDQYHGDIFPHLPEELVHA